MNLSVRVLPEARQDIQDAETFLEGRRLGLGVAFVEEVLDSLNRIKEMPRMYGEVRPGLRAAGVKRFNYVIYYQILQASVEVIAVMHGSRNPAAWQNRL
jgi:plasmid stabilization system protein ParE